MRIILITSLLALTLVSCNHGSSNNTPEPAPPALAQSNVLITTDNAQAVAHAGVRGSLDFLRLAYIGARFLQTTIPDPDTNDPIAPGVLGALVSTEVPGPEGGTATFTWDDLDQSRRYSTGDVFTISFVDYGAQRMVLNGVMTIDNLHLLGLLPGDGTYIADATINLLGLSVQLGALTQTFSMQLPFRLENRIIVEIFDLFFFEDLAWGPLEVQKNTRLLRSENQEGVRYTLDGSVHSPELAGTLRFATNYFNHSGFLNDPTEGALLIRGAANTSVEIEPSCFQPGLCFFLDVRVDADGDEEYEETQSTTWLSLLPQELP